MTNDHPRWRETCDKSWLEIAAEVEARAADKARRQADRQQREIAAGPTQRQTMLLTHLDDLPDQSVLPGME